THLAWIGQHRGIDFVIGADDDIDEAQCRAQGDAEGAGIIPLVGSEVDIERYRCTGLLRCLGSEERRTATRFLAQASATNQQDATIAYRGCPYIVDVQ